MSIPKTTKIFIAITIFILLIAIVFIVISKNKSTPSSSVSPGSSNQTAPALPQATSGASNQAAPASSSPSTSQNSAPETTTPPIQAPSGSFSIEKQTDYSYDTIKADPAIERSVRNVKSDFNLGDIGVSFPIATSKLKKGDEVLLLSGCTPHFCGGTGIVIAYNKTDKKSYIFKEKIGSGVGYEIFGNPTEEIKNLLVYYFIHQ
ncbi:MAG: hypothetical protein NT170_04320 [Candidatus Moranbacteria bacterium]|nr:hypothetical protein [Candidatus Moranbacteria bacterium]